MSSRAVVVGTARLVLLLILVALPAAAVAASDCSRFEEGPRLLGRHPILDPALSVALVGDLVYAMEDHPGVLRIIDVSDPASPVPISATPAPQVDPELTQQFLDIEVAGGLVYTTYTLFGPIDIRGGIQVYDVSDPHAPFLLGADEWSAPGRKVSVLGSFAYVTTGTTGVAVVDVADPSLPARVATLPIPNYDAYRLCSSGQHVYPISGGLGGLKVVDVSDPMSPVIVREMPGGDDIVTDGERLLVGDGPELRLYDLADPADPVLLASEELDTEVGVIGIHGQRVYTTGGVFGRGRVVNVLDLGRSSPADLSYLGSCNLAVGDLWDICGNDTHAFGVSGSWIHPQTGYLEVIDATTPGSPGPLRSTPTPEGTGVPQANLELSGNKLFVGTKNGIGLFDVTEPSTPQFVSRYLFDTNVDLPTVMGANGDLGLEVVWPIAFPFELRVVDFSDAANPTLVGSLAFGMTQPGRMAPIGNLVYMPIASELQVVDLSTPSSPSVATTLATPVSGRDIAVQGNLAYLAGWSGDLCVIDASTPASPSILGTWVSPHPASCVTVSGSLAFLATDDGFLEVVDVAVPTTPVGVGLLDLSDFMLAGVSEIAVNGDFAYLATDTPGVLVVDVSDPTDPVGVGWGFLPERAPGLAITGNYLQVGVGLSSSVTTLETFGLQCDLPGDVGVDVRPDVGDDLSLRVFPNPLHSAATVSLVAPERTFVELTVHDVAGRHVATLAHEDVAPGSHRFVWDGRNENGRPVAGGVYFVRLETERETATRRLVRLR